MLSDKMDVTVLMYLCEVLGRGGAPEADDSLLYVISRVLLCGKLCVTGYHSKKVLLQHIVWLTRKTLGLFSLMQFHMRTTCGISGFSEESWRSSLSGDETDYPSSMT